MKKARESNLQRAPKGISLIVETFSQEIVPGSTPRFVTVLPRQGCPPNECYVNVDSHIVSEGGSKVMGWAIWEWPEAMIEAEAHCVWKSPKGNLIDITQRTDGCRKILFLEDPNLIYEGFQIDNIRKPLFDHPFIHEFIQNAKQFYEIMNRGANRHRSEVSLDRNEVEPLVRRQLELQKIIQREKKRHVCNAAGS